MGDIIDLDEYRKSKQKSPRQDRYEDIMQVIEEFLEANPVDLNPFYVSLDDMTTNQQKPIAVDWPPMLYTDLAGQKWAVSGQNWLEVPEETTFKDLDQYMVVAKREGVQPLAEVRTYDVEGSKGNRYTVTDHGGTWTCTCAGFGWRRKCRHITEVKDASR